MDWQLLQNEFPDPDCYLVALDDRQLNLIHHLLSVFPKYYRNWGYSRGTLDEQAWDEIQSWVSELEGCLMSGCKVSDLTASIDRLTAAIAGEAAPGEPPAYDYTQTGVVPTLNTLFTTSEELFYDSRNMAEILSIGLIGRKLDLLPLPWEGTGLADIVDDQIGTANVNLDELHNRFTQSDISLDGTPFTKNITETLETLLRKTGVLDPEFMPNITDVLDDSFNIRGDVIWTGWGKNLMQWLVNRSGLLPSHKQKVMEWFESKETISAIDILMLIAQTLDDLETQTAKIDASTQVTINTLQNCAPGTNGNGTGGTGETSVITITDEGAQITGPEPPPLLEN